MPARLAPFDPNATFIVRRLSLIVARRIYRKDDQFDASSVPVRTLKQLYTQRAISYPGVGERPAPAMMTLPTPVVEPVVEPAEADTAESLVGANTKAELIAMAESLGLDVEKTANKATIAGQIIEARADGNP